MKQLFLISLLFLGVLFATPASAVDMPDGDVVNFAPSSNWYTWIVRSASANSGRGQTFVTAPDTESIQTIAVKACRFGNFTQPKTLTLCAAPQNGWYGGCSDPLAEKEFTAEELNALTHQDPDCFSTGEGGNADGEYYKWTPFSFDEPVAVSPNQSYFFLFNSSEVADNEGNRLRAMYNNCNWLGSSQNYTSGQTYYYRNATRYSEDPECDLLFKVYSADPITVPFEITSPIPDEQVVKDTWVTVSGTCPIDGPNRIGFTDNCLGFADIDYTLSCTDNTFSGSFYFTGQHDNRIIARDIESVSGDCVDYDDLMDAVTVDGVDFIDGYPAEWYTNFGDALDYDIRILDPRFDVSVSLPRGSSEETFTFQFIYPPDELADLAFNIRQYNSDGDLLAENYHSRTLLSMPDTDSYTVTLAASTTPYHYVVQLMTSSTLVRQFPFGIYVSDLDFVLNPDEGDYFFPRIVEALRQKIVFNYYFAFHDGFYTLFNGEYASPSSDALDITFHSVSGNGEYNIDIPIFSPSNPTVRSFTLGIRPYIVALLWLGFASYVVYRIAHLFTNNQ